MTVKLLLLKSNEEVIADVQELVDENDKVLFAVLTNRFVVKLEENPELLAEGASSNQPRYSCRFYQWMPMSSENRIPIDPSWIVAAVEPLETVKQSYEEKMNGLGN